MSVENVILDIHKQALIKQKKILSEKIKVEKPLSYKQVIYYLKYAKLLITDSGGIQKEAFFAKTQTLTIRNETEWLETIKAKYNRLVEPKENLIYAFVKKYISFKGINSKPCGNGKTAKLIFKIIKNKVTN